ncbi:hypothetical protein AVEN_27328-1 [Araneus ventricosus]|uniref:Uncharacterized protein n=1 Tax=Araneus ventricosus TaxID=182803 RepID=A0A4Y2GIH6_ARAVE|nr:hypothetical protein AVEN_27328-1 [Araneus ventricosus]
MPLSLRPGMSFESTKLVCYCAYMLDTLLRLHSGRLCMMIDMSLWISRWYVAVPICARLCCCASVLEVLFVPLYVLPTLRVCARQCYLLPSALLYASGAVLCCGDWSNVHQVGWKKKKKEIHRRR